MDRITVLLLVLDIERILLTHKHVMQTHQQLRTHQQPQTHPQSQHPQLMWVPLEEMGVTTMATTPMAETTTLATTAAMVVLL